MTMTGREFVAAPEKLGMCNVEAARDECTRVISMDEDRGQSIPGSCGVRWQPWHFPVPRN